MKRVGKLLGHYLYTRFRRYAVWPTWRLLFTSFFFFFLALFFLRSNNITALEKYRQVIKADENGGSVYEKLDDLQKFTFGHLNSDIGRPVQLVNTYNRDANAIFAKAQTELSADGASPDIYLVAQKECEARGIPITARAQCVADYVVSNNPEVEEEKLEVQLPDKALYSFRFPSPKWTWDLAGISILLSLIFFAGALLRMALARHLRKRWAGWDSKYLVD
jgi:hypothetical protein